MYVSLLQRSPAILNLSPTPYTSQVCSIRSVSSFLGMQGSRNPKTRLLPNSVYYILLFFNWNSFRCAHLVGIDSPSSGTNSHWAQNQYGLLALRIRVKNWEIVRHLSSRVVWMTSVKSCDRDRARPPSQVSHCKRAKYLAGVPTRNETLIK